MTPATKIFLLWGKTEDSEAGEKIGYPALCHMLDVGLVALSLLERQGANWPGVLGLDAHAAAITLPKWLAFLVALHDLGKLSPGFQAKCPELLALLGEQFPVGRSDEKDHGRVTFETLPCLLETRTGCPFEIADQLGRAVAAHHGSFHKARQRPDDAGDGAWEQVREQAVDRLLAVFALDWDDFPFRSEDSLTNAAILLLAGLTSVADWLGSDKQRFPYRLNTATVRPDFSLSAYRDERMQIARDLVDELNLVTPNRPHQHHTFGELFRFESGPARPNPTQQAVLEVLHQLDPLQPGLILVETPMGSGKTEAALATADHWLAQGLAQGVYYALPTRATANAMLGRVHDFLQQSVPEPTQLHLLHASADLQPEYRALFGQVLEAPEPLEIYDAVNPRDDSSIRADEWFTARKRGLISPFSVGTVDQALLAMLKEARHFFVRIFGLAGKVVVIDEVHAYDTYTSELLRHLLLWLGALRVPVVLLSATLPDDKRRELLQAYEAEAQLPERVVYPCVLAVQPAVEKAVYRQIDWPDTKPFDLEYIELGEDQFHIRAEETLRSLLDQGGNALCLVNTVDEAQALYAHLARTLDLGADLHLFHARFPLEQRAQIEEQMKRLFGKNKTDRPHRAVLVATQVVEQSLDVDFDLLLTQLAPIDLLFQRMGRVHRHTYEERPLPLRRPRLLCFAQPLPTESDLTEINLNNDRSLGQFVRKQFGNTGFVYGQALLLKTALVLRERASASATLVIPQDIQPLIGQVYGPESVRCPDYMAELMIALEDRGWILDLSGRRLAKGATLPPPDAADFLLDQEERTFDEDRAFEKTRLALPSITLVPLYHDNDGAWFIDAGMTQPVDLEPTPDRESVERLIRRSVSISKADWVRHFKEQQVPAAWRKSPHLRYLRLLALDAAGICAWDNRFIRLDSNLGVVFGSQSDSNAPKGIVEKNHGDRNR